MIQQKKLIYIRILNGASNEINLERSSFWLIFALLSFRSAQNLIEHKEGWIREDISVLIKGYQHSKSSSPSAERKNGECMILSLPWMLMYLNKR